MVIVVIDKVKELVGTMVDKTKEVVSENRYGGNALAAQMGQYEIGDLLTKIEGLKDSDLRVDNVGGVFEALNRFYAERDSNAEGYTAGQTAYSNLHDALIEKKKELSSDKQSDEGATAAPALVELEPDPSSSAGAGENRRPEGKEETKHGDGSTFEHHGDPQEEHAVCTTLTCSLELEQSKEKIEGIDALLKILDYFMQTKSETDKLVKYADKIEKAGFFGKLTGHDTSVSKAFKVALAAIAMGAASMYTAGVVATALAAFSASAVVYSSLRVMSTYDVARRNNISIMKVKESALRYSTGKVELATAVLTTAAGALFPLFGVARVLSAAALAVRLPLSIAVSFVQSGRDFLKVNSKTPEGGSIAEYLAEGSEEDAGFVSGSVAPKVSVPVDQLKPVISTLKKQADGHSIFYGISFGTTDDLDDDAIRNAADQVSRMDLGQLQTTDKGHKEHLRNCQDSLKELCRTDQQGRAVKSQFEEIKKGYGLTATLT